MADASDTMSDQKAIEQHLSSMTGITCLHFC